jgi:hypothetical protein
LFSVKSHRKLFPLYRKISLSLCVIVLIFNHLSHLFVWFSSWFCQIYARNYVWHKTYEYKIHIGKELSIQRAGFEHAISLLVWLKILCP